MITTGVYVTMDLYDSETDSLFKHLPTKHGYYKQQFSSLAKQTVIIILAQK